MEGATGVFCLFVCFNSCNYSTLSPPHGKVVLSSKILPSAKVNDISDHEPVQLQEATLDKAGWAGA